MKTFPSQSSYLFAGAYTTARMFSLISENQIERLFGARNESEIMDALQDTFLAPYLASTSSINESLEKAVTQAKKDLISVSPDPDLLLPLWYKYDFYNIRNIIKGTLKGLSEEEILASCFETGMFTPKELFDAFTDGTLVAIHPFLHKVVEQAKSVKDSYEIDAIKNKEYFNGMAEFAKTTKNTFILSYITLLTDLFNLKTKLRLTKLKNVTQRDIFAHNGSIPYFVFESLSPRELFSRFGGSDYWDQALTEYENNSSFALVDKLSEEYIHSFLKRESMNLWSIAPQYAYFNAMKNNVQTVRAIIAGKNAGIPESELRINLRKIFR
ncbi:MAG: V-type ATPase subunit [Candidatus Paceibacterota bacterium]